jgi:TolB-like protein/Tfp pilus assembly protein PilF
VRVEASKLRGLLRKYYESEGVTDPVVVDIPKGTYVPVVSARTSEAHLTPGAPPTAELQANGGLAGHFDAVGEDQRPAAAELRPRRHAASRITLLGLTAAALLAAVAWRFYASEPAAIAVDSRPAIAVLPFEDISQTDAYDYIAPGLTQEVTTTLGAIDTLRVPARSAVARYATSPRDVTRMGRELGVHAVLEGTVQVEGDRVRVNAALIDAPNGFQLWTRSFERPLGDVFEIQRDLAQAIVDQFNLDHPGAQRALARQTTRSFDAYQYYLRASHRFSGDAGDLGAVVDLYRAATVADPSYALAWAGYSIALTTRAHWGFARASDVEAPARVAAERALALDANLTESQHAVALVLTHLQRDLPRAEQAFRRAIQLDPLNMLARRDLVNLILIRGRRLEEALDEVNRALAVDPRDFVLRLSAARVHEHLGQTDRALQQARLAFEQAPESPAVLVNLGRLEARIGDMPQAARRFEAATSAIRSAWVLSYLGWAWASLGRVDDARGLLLELSMAPSADRDVAIAAIELGLGNRAGALAAIERAAASGSLELIGLEIDPRFTPVHDEPRFRAAVGTQLDVATTTAERSR